MALAFLYIALYVGAGEYHVVRASEQTFAGCQREARWAESRALPFDEENPVTSMCFALDTTERS